MQATTPLPQYVKQMGVFCTLPSFTGFCVYVHRRATDGQIFYVDLGRRARVRQKAGRNPSWAQAVAEHGYTYEVVGIFDTAIKAAEREVELIAKYRDEGAPLVNRTVGGEGVAHWLTPAPDPVAAYRTAQAHRALQMRIDHWRTSKMVDYRIWLRTTLDAKGREARAVAKAEAALREERYRASLR